MDGKKQYRISDHLASLRVTVDDGEVKTYDYDPWGQPIAVPTDDRSRRTYNDREKDRESGTYNLGVRQYNDDEGRFSAVDKKWDATPGITPYAYANNNPQRYTDPSGLQARKIVPTDGGGHGGIGFAGAGRAAGATFGATWYRRAVNWVKGLFSSSKPSAPPPAKPTVPSQSGAGSGTAGTTGAAKGQGSSANSGARSDGTAKSQGTKGSGNQSGGSTTGGKGSGSEQVNKAAETPDKFSRTPKSTMDEMVLKAAKQGKGRKIMDNLNDPKFKGMEKWSYTEKSANGLHSEVHYVRDPKNRKTNGFQVQASR